MISGWWGFPKNFSDYYVFYCKMHSTVALNRFIYILDSSILVQSHFELVILVLGLEATEPVSKPVTQMALELINNYLISVP